MQTGPWICDHCGKPIEKAEDGYVEWLVRRDEVKEGEPKLFGMKIIHNISQTDNPIGCHYDDQYEYRIKKAIVNSLSLKRLQGDDGLMTPLQLIDEGEFDNKELITIIKRIFITNYEQARPYMHEAVSLGEIEPNLPEGYFFQSQLKRIISWAEKERENYN